MHVVVGRVTHWLWRAVDDQGAVLDVLLQRHRDTSAAASLFRRLLREYDVPETVSTDKLTSYDPCASVPEQYRSPAGDLNRPVQQSN